MGSWLAVSRALAQEAQVAGGEDLGEIGQVAASVVRVCHRAPASSAVADTPARSARWASSAFCTALAASLEMGLK